MVVSPDSGELPTVCEYMSLLAEIPFFFTSVFPWVFVWTGVCFAGDAAKEIRRACASKRWPTVEGIVVLAHLEETEVGGDDYSHTAFTPAIEYRFTLGGVSRVSRRVANCAIHPGSRQSAEAVLGRYKVGRTVRVYCSPHDSAVAILEPGLRWPLVGKLLFGLLLLVAGVALLWFFRASESSRFPL